MSKEHAKYLRDAVHSVRQGISLIKLIVLKFSLCFAQKAKIEFLQASVGPEGNTRYDHD
jgi:hypothetical protein